MNKAPRTPPRGPTSSKDSRRRFLRLVAGGAAAIVLSPVPNANLAQAAVKPRAKPKPKAKAIAPSRSKKIEAGLKDQKDFVARTLKTIREYELETGSAPSFTFEPLPAAKASRDQRSSR